MKAFKCSFIWIVLLLFTGMVSCTDLTETPHSEITEINFKVEKDDIPGLVAPVYTELRWFMNCCYGYVSMQESVGDGYVTPGRPNGWGGPFIEFHRHNWDSDHPYVTTAWDNIYKGVRAANRLLYELNEVLRISGELKLNVESEVRAVRAFYYFLLLDSYGSVPLDTRFEPAKDSKQASRQQVYTFVEQELTEAIPNLPEEVNQHTYGRITRWAAQALLADLYLNAKVYTGKPEYDKVIPLADKIINSGHFYLEDKYRAVFSRNNHTSPEIIFGIPYDEEQELSNTMHVRNVYRRPDFDWSIWIEWGGSAATHHFIDTYDKADSRLEATWESGPQFSSDGDTIITYRKHISSINSAGNDEGLRAYKYEIYEELKIQSDVDFPVYRYADILMMKAEALLRTGSPDEAASVVTQVRQRAFADLDPGKAQVTGAELMQETSYDYGYWETNDQQNFVDQDESDIQYGRFLDELGWEFAVEGHRRQDLIRFGVYSKKGWFHKRPSDPCKTVFPIPESALSADSELEQHECYR